MPATIENSDKPGQHDFEILKRLVLPDGSVLRARYPGRPSRDCLFVDPVMDGKRYVCVSRLAMYDVVCVCSFSNHLQTVYDSLLKIWNLNKCNGVIGIFNCQGAGSWPCLEHIVQVKASDELSGKVSPADIEYFEEVSGKLWTGDCAVYSFKQGIRIQVRTCSMSYHPLFKLKLYICSNAIAGCLSRLPKDKSLDVTLQLLQCDVFTVSPIKVGFCVT